MGQRRGKQQRVSKRRSQELQNPTKFLRADPEGNREERRAHARLKRDGRFVGFDPLVVEELKRDALGRVVDATDPS